MFTTPKLTAKSTNPNFNRLAIALFVTIFLLFATLLNIPVAQASPQTQTGTPTPQATPTFDLQRLEKPVLDSTNTQQLKEGSLIYWGVCMACHGDRGQGLTEEWKGAFGKEDQNCWNVGCHGYDHPPQGFFIPKDKAMPAVAGMGSLTRFQNAQELHDFILANMPWWDPGKLTDEKTWQVTSYILSLKKVMPSKFELSATNASAIRTQDAVPPPANDRPAIFVLLGILTLAGVGMIAQELQRGQIRLPERPNFFHHLHPPTIPVLQARFRYTLGAGGLAILLCLVLLVTGILEMFYYIPTPEHAGVSVEVITSLVPFGGLIRNLHFWAAQALMIVASIHLLRIFLTGAYARHRRLNYLIGLGMLVLILLLDFTGYVLRWDEGIRWALVVGTNLLKTIPWVGGSLYQLAIGGPEPSHSTLERFYTWHIFVLTMGLIVLGGWHIFRVRRDGGVAVPPPHLRKDNNRISRFDLVRREMLIMGIAGLLLILIAILFPAPIERPITQASVDLHNARAPWFFLWVQQLLKLGNPFLWGVLTPVLLLVALAAIPYILPQTHESELGQWFPRGNRLAQILLIVIAVTIIILTILAILPTTQL